MFSLCFSKSKDLNEGSKEVPLLLKARLMLCVLLLTKAKARQPSSPSPPPPPLSPSLPRFGGNSREGLGNPGFPDEEAGEEEVGGNETGEEDT